MAGWLERAAGPGGPGLALVYLELLLALTLIATVLHFRGRRGTADELKAVRTYFLAFFSFLLVLPVVIILLAADRPLAALSSFGWTFGRARLGAVLTLAGLPLAVLGGFIGSHDPGLQKIYPLAKAACADARTFAGYEFSYLILYYLPWESVFRGVLFLKRTVPAETYIRWHESQGALMTEGEKAKLREAAQHDLCLAFAVGTGGSTYGPLRRLRESEPPEFGVSEDAAGMVYELKIPLAQSDQEAISVGAPAGGTVGIGFETGKIDLDSLPRGPGGIAGGAAGMPPVGGYGNPGAVMRPGQLRPKEPEIPENLKVWATVTLSTDANPAPVKVQSLSEI